MKITAVYGRRGGFEGLRKPLDYLNTQSHDVYVRHEKAAAWFGMPTSGILLLDHVAAMNLGERIIDVSVPVIIFEITDGSQIGLRELLPYDNVRAILKRSIFKPKTLNNEVIDRYHVFLMHDQARVSNPKYKAGRPKQLTVRELDKVYPLLSFASLAGVRNLLRKEINWKEERPIDLHFAGTTSYKKTEIEWHRKQAINAIKGWDGNKVASSGRKMSVRAYRQQLLKTKVTLSPWGWGETCHRDFEAMLSGSVLLKPDMRHVDTWGDLFVDGETCFFCKPDLSDVRDKTQMILDKWDSLREMRIEAKRRVVRTADPVNIANRLMEILKCVL